MKKYFTTPIYYVNDKPHIGHAYCTLATDTLVRFWRGKIGKENVFFLTGTDENSQKTVDAAKEAGKAIPEYLEEMAKNWRETWEGIGISFDDFIRTTEQRHIDTVHEIFQRIHDGGDIYEDQYVGKYCTGCETFLKDSELDENGNCPDHKKPPKELKEDNYFFRLSKYEKPLLELFEKNPHFLEPASRRNEIVNFIKSGLEDISVSRETAEFGITLPIDEKHKVYVWFDALINYVSGVQDRERADFWPAIHIIGKDITRFHAVIWPAMLLAAGIEPPKQVFAHGFFTIDGVKMSKSLGNVVNPVDLANKYGKDALRLGLLSSFEFGGDGDFSVDNFADFYRTKLAGGVGNLFNRVVVLIHKFLEGQKPAGGDLDTKKIWKKFEDHFEKYEIREAIDLFFHTVHEANQLLNETEVWKLAKTDLEGAKKIFATLIQYLEILTEMGEILLPEKHPEMQKMLGNDQKIGEPEILFDQQ